MLQNALFPLWGKCRLERQRQVTMGACVQAASAASAAIARLTALTTAPILSAAWIWVLGTLRFFSSSSWHQGRRRSR